MSSRMRRPETVRLNISRGDWVLVKKHLTAGEYRAMMAGMIRVSEGDAPVAMVDPVRVGLSKIVAYMLDWSIEDADGKPVEIRDKSAAEVEAAVNAIDIDCWREILVAVEAHDGAMANERKNVPSGESAPLATSTSAA